MTTATISPLEMSQLIDKQRIALETALANGEHTTYELAKMAAQAFGRKSEDPAVDNHQFAWWVAILTHLERDPSVSLIQLAEIEEASKNLPVDPDLKLYMWELMHIAHSSRDSNFDTKVLTDFITHISGSPSTNRTAMFWNNLDEWIVLARINDHPELSEQLITIRNGRHPNNH